MNQEKLITCTVFNGRDTITKKEKSYYSLNNKTAHLIITSTEDFSKETLEKINNLIHAEIDKEDEV